MPLDFSGQTAIVLGNADLAAGTRLHLQERGANVFGAEAPNGEHSVHALVERVASLTGRVDILVTAPDQPMTQTLADVTTESFERILHQSLMQTFWASQAVLPRMRKQNYGRIVHCVSGAGAFGADQGAPLAIAHAGIIALTKSLALGNLDRAVHSNVLAATTLTPSTQAFFDAHRYLDAAAFGVAEIIPALSYLAHKSCAVNGESFSAAAGRFAKLIGGVTLGIFDPDLSDDSFGARIDEINDNRFSISPRTLQDELVTVAV